MKKKLISMLLVCSMVLSMAACGGKEEEKPAETETETEVAAEEEAASERDTSVLYTNQGPVEYFEIPWFNGGCWITDKAMFQPMIGADEKQSPTTEVGLCESYELSEDGLTLTLVMRDGVTWHDGEAVTPDDVLFSLKTAALPTSATIVNPIIKTTLAAIEGYEAVADGSADSFSGITVDGNTITIKLTAVVPTVVLAMTMFAPLPEHLLADADMTQLQQDPFFQAPVGNGAWKLDSCVMGEYANMVPYENFWNGVPTYSIYASSSAMDSDPNFVTNAAAGKMDYGYTKSYADTQALADVDGITVDTVDVNYTRFLQFNTWKRDANDVNPLADVRVRHAIAMALDRELICAQVFGGASKPGIGTSTPTGSAWKNEDVEGFEYNVEAAKALLDEAGYDYDRVLKIGYYYTDQGTVDLMAIIQQMLAQVGVQVEPYLMEGDLSALINTLPTNGVSGVQWDMMYGALAATSIHDYYSRYSNENGRVGAFCQTSEEFSAKVDKMMVTPDEAEQMKIYKELEAEWADEFYEAPLYYQPVWMVTSEKVAGNVDTWGNPQFFWNNNMQNWTLK